MTNNAILVLADGTTYQGISVGVAGCTVGEVVFNTAITGYQEILSDPSYAHQIVTLTHPHVGNTGTNQDDDESCGVYAAGLVVRDLPRFVSNFRAQQPLNTFLQRHKVVAIAGIDSRALTRRIRQQGAQVACLMTGDRLDRNEALLRARQAPGLQGVDLAAVVSTTQAYDWTSPSWRFPGAAVASGSHVEAATADEKKYFNVVAYDFGVKRNILRLLVDRGCRVHVVPASTSAATVLEMVPDGVFLSNGPGDPEPCDYVIAAIQRLLEQSIPLFGICLGHQLLALACGARTEKMKFGHHGANHPVQDLDTGRVLITSQNHGFSVSTSDLPDSLRITHRSLFDGSIQGLECREKPAFSFQGHPEASPGPHEAGALFDRFIAMMKAYKQGVCDAQA
ncbi:MAG TPA: carbamoyl-phosphate synthase small subunit [Gammaproteobacteria bacterium]|mgnify:CR=1 FL=1|nr:carbamoyl-phosphate synthase small subunit [Gammaproteobacteria bacterium]